MLCQKCQKNVANVYFTQIINGKKVEMYLCEQCAKEKGQLSFSPQLNLGDFLWGLVGLAEGGDVPKPDDTEKFDEVKCKLCGMSFRDFKKTGKLGCGNCYMEFREKLNPLLRRVHGNIKHTGKIPEKIFSSIEASNEIERLKTELTMAISKEEYEKAAELRDRIKELETVGNKPGGV